MQLKACTFCQEVFPDNVARFVARVHVQSATRDDLRMLGQCTKIHVFDGNVDGANDSLDVVVKFVVTRDQCDWRKRFRRQAMSLLVYDLFWGCSKMPRIVRVFVDGRYMIEYLIDHGRVVHQSSYATIQ